MHFAWNHASHLSSPPLLQCAGRVCIVWPLFCSAATIQDTKTEKQKKGQEECRFIVRCTEHHHDRRQWWFLVCLLPRLWCQNSCRSSSTNENQQRARTTSNRLTLYKIWYTVFPEPFENANGAISIQELRMIQFHCCSGTCQPTNRNQQRQSSKSWTSL